MSNPTTGQLLRDRGTALATAKRPSKTIRLRIAILRLAIEGKDITIDDVLEPEDQVKRTNHVEAAMLSLSTRKLIKQTGERRRSRRDYRHAGSNPVWVAVDVDKCRAELARLGTELERLESVPKQGGLFTDPSSQGPGVQSVGVLALLACWHVGSMIGGVC